MPTTSYPSCNARNVTPRIAGFSPGTSPPPVRIPMIPLLFAISERPFPVCHWQRFRTLNFTQVWLETAREHHSSHLWLFVRLQSFLIVGFLNVTFMPSN